MLEVTGAKRALLTLIPALFVILVLPDVCSSQPERGATELSFSATFDAIKYSDCDNCDTYKTAEIAVSNGFFANGVLELGYSVSLIAVSYDEPQGAYSAFVSFHFPSDGSPILPFVGALIGSTFSQAEKEPLIFGFYGGIKGFVAEGAAIIVQPYFNRWNWESISYYGGTIDRDLNQFGIRSGVALFL